MSVRYRPSARLIIIGLLMAGLLLLNVIAVQPALRESTAQLAELRQTRKDIALQLQQKPSDAEQRLLARAAWTGADWTQAIIDSMATAKNGTPQLEATYALGNPTEVTLADELYAAQRLDLEIKANDDPSIFRFIDRLQETLPGATSMLTLQVQRDDQTGDLTATASMALYRLVQP